MAKFFYVVLSKAAEGQEEEFHEWYDAQHLPDCVKVEGVTAARRYRVLHEVGPAPAGSPELKAPFDSVALYELECEDPTAVARHLSALAGTDAMKMTSAIDRTASVKYVAIPQGAISRDG